MTRFALPLVLLAFAACVHADESKRWFNQLDNVDPALHAIAGNWSKSADGLKTNAVASSRIIVPAKVPREYDFRVQFTRHSGQHSVALFFTCGTGIATYEIDAWGKNLAGIQQIDGQSITSNPTRTENRRLQNGRKYTAEVRVRRNGVTVFLDNERFASYEGDGSNLTLLPLWRLRPDAQLGVGAYQAETTFHSIELRTVSGASTIPTAPEKIAMLKPVTKPRPNTPPAAQRSPNSDQRVLIVIADNHFYYREYADPRQELERAGFRVDVAAGNRNECYPHANSGQGSSGGGVRPDFALSEVDPSKYQAIVFSGGWGASMYQYAFRGRYNSAQYNGDQAKKNAANELINAFHDQDKYIVGICNGVSVLAWSRVGGKSLLAGKTCTAPTRSAPAGVYDGRRASPSIRWHVEKNQGQLVPPGSIGNPNSRNDDVVVDGKIITAEDDHAAREAGRQLAKLLKQ